MIDTLAILIAALCGVLAYHAHVTAKRLRVDIDAARERIASTEALCQVLRGEIAVMDTRLHGIDRDVGQLCTREGIKRYGERG